jgi:hypothetical protein
MYTQIKGSSKMRTYFFYTAVLTALLFVFPGEHAAVAQEKQDAPQIASNKHREKNVPKTQADYEREAKEGAENSYDEYSDNELVQDSNRDNTDYGTHSYGSTSFGFQPK